MSIRKFALAGVALALALCVSASSVEAKTVSINFVGGGSLTSGQVAGFVPVANWNNLNANSGVLGDTVGELVDDSGADSGLLFSFGTQGARGANAPVAPATAGDTVLFSGGREGDINANNQTTAQFLIENLNTVFANGYSIYWYFGDSELAAQSSSGTAYKTTNTAAFTFGNGANDPVVGSLGTAIGSVGPANGTAFNGTYTFTSNGNTLLDSNLTDDALVYSFRQTAGGPSFWGLLQVGVQIVGNDPVPEPSTFALAGIGLVGLVGYGLRRRNRKSA